MSLAEVMRMRQRDVVGRLGAPAAPEYRERVGLHILARACRWVAGRTGTVAARRRVLVACEVKDQSVARYRGAGRSVTGEKVRRLRRPAVGCVLARGLALAVSRAVIAGGLRCSWGDFSLEHVGVS